MSDQAPPPANPTPDASVTPKGLTAAQAAKRVKRMVTVTNEGVQEQAELEVKAAEVLSFKDYGTHVVVVTVDGQKFSSAKG